MHTPWDTLAQQAELATQDESQLLAQVQALRHGSVIAEQSGFTLLKVTGEEAQTFLQNQLSSDLREVNASTAQYSTYSNAKGRMLANFLIWQTNEAYYLLLSADIANMICKRLNMFVLRAKVTIQLVEQEWSVFGLAGPLAEEFVSNTFKLSNPLDKLAVVQHEHSLIIALPGQGYLWALSTNQADDYNMIFNNERMTFISQQVWSLRDIDAGIAWVKQATQESFVPQMANMEILGAVNFKKGCYPGQEIVARTQYLGKVKRRLFRVSLDRDLPIGTKLFNPNSHGQAIGILAALCLVETSCYEGLAVVQIQAWEEGIYADEQLSIPLNCLTLPYLFIDNPKN